MIAAAMAGGDVTVRNIIPKHMDSLTAKLAEMGVERVGINVASAIEIVDALNRMPYESKTLLIS